MAAQLDMPPDMPPAADPMARGARPDRAGSREHLDVRLDGVTKAYGHLVAVDDISLTIERGEFFSLLGPSGCGKSTTLSMIGGFAEPTYGAIYLNGVDVSRQPPYRRDVNTVFQSYALFPHLDVYENVAFGLKRKHVDRKAIERRVRDMLALVDLTGFHDRRPAQLSGGQQQRVALARALVNRPKLLLLDEPLGALDLKLRKQMQLELKRIQSEVGITFLYVTHDQEEAMVMSDRLAVMAGGRIEQVGPPDVVYDSPATEFVAGFLGASNLMAGEVVERGGALARVRLDDGLVVQVARGRLGDRGPRVKVGVRPEKIQVLPAGQPVPEGRNSLEAVVAMTAYIGVSHQYTMEGPDGRSFSAYAQNLGTGPHPARGDRVRLCWHPEHTFVVEPSAPRAAEESSA
ncbi:spermidine/putrescine transport system ATP-binding protein [Tistlia consotensis]|uniref:Spermidine/putrescine import ATP-binding protein PotA n=1 Tax=Tistlia consotensis USBA 355 TaxID=560819 RepID=A0A1Y6B956_9PROT|nr:ABC transporter ATP-binding protein [Tistlia consotensis]SME99386.1 spermidine/putrescine transport system ATP-binding protein [Tistlia consotensis USBA 355]SNR76981.1 spermidine/putrescine transport system ATP-binding protein [Tistlia consotensis]